MISAEEIKALMTTLDKILEPKKFDGRLGGISALANESRNALSTLQTLLNQAAEAKERLELALKLIRSIRTGTKEHDESCDIAECHVFAAIEDLAAIQPYLTTGDTNE